jgi:hypothetical protein
MKQNQSEHYVEFEKWCLENNFKDVINCKLTDVDLNRLTKAIDEYWISKFERKFDVIIGKLDSILDYLNENIFINTRPKQKTGDFENKNNPAK